jgi:hypothetical protein
MKGSGRMTCSRLSSGTTMKTGSRRTKKLAIRSVGILRERGDSLDNQVIMDKNAVRSLADDSISYSSVYVRVDNPEKRLLRCRGDPVLGLTANGAFRQIESVNRLMDTSSFSCLFLPESLLSLVRSWS